jgi:DNA-binding GntR family transcriptional regulator
MQETRSGEVADIEREAVPWTTATQAGQGNSFFHAVAVVRRIVVETHDRPSLVSRIACEVGAEIIENVRAPGQDLNSVELARRYKTSRTPIREALMLLEKEGLVYVPPRRRPRVAAFNLKEVREIYHLRSGLLARAAANVATEATEDDLALLRAGLSKMFTSHAKRDLDGYLWANVEFHNHLTNAARNRTAKRIIDSLLLRTLRLRRLSLAQPARLDKSVANHIQLVDAFEDRDAPLASALVHSNHLKAFVALERYLTSPEGSRSLSSQHDADPDAETY